MALPNLSSLSLQTRHDAPTAEFYPLPQKEADRLNDEQGGDTISGEPFPVMSDNTFRLPYPDDAPRDADGSYKYRVYDAPTLWLWVKEPTQRFDPADRTPLLRSDWELLRDRFEPDVPTPPDGWRPPIPANLWSQGNFDAQARRRAELQGQWEEADRRNQDQLRQLRELQEREEQRRQEEDYDGGRPLRWLMGIVRRRYASEQQRRAARQLVLHRWRQLWYQS